MPDNYDNLSRDQLIGLLRKRDLSRRLGLVWERDEIEHERLLEEAFPLVELDTDLSRGKGPWKDLLIEGDNFDALRFLRAAFKGQVKCIYIDPPYNTGNKDFVYNDHYVDADNAFRQSTWLEFLYRRLVLARDLLAENGVLLVSINDENRALLDLLLSQIWPGGRKGSFVWRSRIGDNSGKGANLSINHEHVLVWAGEGFQFRGDEKTYDMYVNRDEYGLFRVSDLTQPKNYAERPNAFYAIHNPDSDIWYPPNPDRVWAFASESKLDEGQTTRKETIEELVRQGRIIFPRQGRYAIWDSKSELLAAISRGEGPQGGNGNQLIRENIDLIPLDFWVGKKVGFGVPAYKRRIGDMAETTQPLSSWVKSAAAKDFEADDAAVHIESGYTDEGSKELRRLLGDKAFNYPKPPSLLRGLIDQATGPGDLILDFFAGSATTAQAVAELNTRDAEAATNSSAEPPKARRWIMVSSTEATAEEEDKNICRDVAARRLAALGLDFAYLRMRSAPAISLGRDINEGLLWPSLCLVIAGAAARMASEGQVAWLESEGLRLGFVRALDSKTLAELASLAPREGAMTVIAAFQPGPLRQRLGDREDIRVLELPTCLAEALLGAAGGIQP